MSTRPLRDSDELRRLLRETIERSPTTERQVALSAGYDPAGLNRFLNGRGGIQSWVALACYPEVCLRLSLDERESYVRAAGLEDRFDQLGLPWRRYDSSSPPLPRNRDQLASRLLFEADTADRVAQNYPLALELSQEAERLYSPKSDGAVKAASSVILHYINIGDLTAGIAKVHRIEGQYHTNEIARLSSETRASLARFKGWSRYYVCEFADALFDFEENMEAAYDSPEPDRLADFHHYGLVALAHAETRESLNARRIGDFKVPYQSNAFELAEHALLRSFEHQQYRTDPDRAFDSLRLAQLYRAMDRFPALAQDRRKYAADVFQQSHFDGGVYALGYVEQEDVTVALLNSRLPSKARRTLDSVVERWSSIKLALGLSDVFRLRAVLDAREGDGEAALASAAIALILHPYRSPNHLDWDHHMRLILAEFCWCMTVTEFEEYISRLADLAHARVPPFHLLDRMVNITDERVEAGIRMLHGLASQAGLVPPDDRDLCPGD